MMVLSPETSSSSIFWKKNCGGFGGARSIDHVQIFLILSSSFLLLFSFLLLCEDLTPLFGSYCLGFSMVLHPFFAISISGKDERKKENFSQFFSNFFFKKFFSAVTPRGLSKPFSLFFFFLLSLFLVSSKSANPLFLWSLTLLLLGIATIRDSVCV